MSAARVALVTGGGRGIGRAIALAFARAGLDVAVVARSREPVDGVAAEIAALGRRSMAGACDVTLAPSVDAAVAAVRHTLGPIDVLVNNAGVDLTGALVELEPERILQLLAVNLAAPMLLSRAVIPGMLGRGRGQIVNVSSFVVNGFTPLAVGCCGNSLNSPVQCGLIE